MRSTFKKAERLNSKILINRVFTEGISFSSYPFRVTFLQVKDEGVPTQILISASKRNYKKAVDRNKIKRLIREAYRKNKYIIWDFISTKPDTTLLISIVYIGKSILTYSEIERKLILILHTLIKKNE